MSKYVVDLNYVNLVCREIASIARTMLSKERSYLCGARKISLLTHLVGAISDHSNLNVFTIVEIETAHLLLKDPEKNGELTGQQGEMEMAELWARISCEPACRSLIARFGA